MKSIWTPEATRKDKFKFVLWVIVEISMLAASINKFMKTQEASKRNRRLAEILEADAERVMQRHKENLEGEGSPWEHHSESIVPDGPIKDGQERLKPIHGVLRGARARLPGGRS